MITPSALADVLGRPVLTPDGQQAVPRAPGSDAAHYAPTLPARCVNTNLIATALRTAGTTALLHYSELAPAVAEQVIARRMPAQANAYAQQLYAALRWADTTGADQLLIELPPEGEDCCGARPFGARHASGLIME